MSFRRVRSFIKLRKIKGQAGIHADAKDVYAEAEREMEHYCSKERELGKEIRRYRDSAWTLHVEGFHEAT